MKTLSCLAAVALAAAAIVLFWLGLEEEDEPRLRNVDWEGW